MVKSAILVVLLLGIGYSNGMLAGTSPMMGNMGGMSSMSNIMMAGALNGGSQSDMMKMMAMMSLMNPTASSTSGTQAGATETPTNPFLNGMMKMGLCRSTETNDSPLCTPALCSIKGQLRYGNPNMYECTPGFGCCYKDHQSMLLGKLLN